MRAGRPADQLEGLVHFQAVPLGDDSFRLLDGDARLECVLELGPSLEGRMRDGEKPSHSGGRVLKGADLYVTFRQDGGSLVATRLQIDDEVALECVGNPEERVDPRRTATPL
ncbi:MAG: hypothetical protein QOE13_775 [Gaiellaceae bacterium]|nr:hypothetical protein [Gaiellaceae bacterium]